MIKYHDNTTGRQYGDDHMLTNNWDPDAKYGKKEYVSIHFRIKCPAFNGMYGSFTNDTDRDAFNKEKGNVFQSIGWNIDRLDNGGYCMETSKGKSSLYLHPQDFTGIVLKNEVKEISEALADNQTFTIRWVDIYETVYDISDEEYAEYLAKKTKETWCLLFENCKTNRRNRYRYRHDVMRRIAQQIQLPRIGCSSVYDPNKGALEFVDECIKEMTVKGYLVTTEQNGYEYIRSLNKTELKTAKLKAIA